MRASAKLPPVSACFVDFGILGSVSTKNRSLVRFTQAAFLRHGLLQPRDKADLACVQQRRGHELADGRPVLERTQKGREKWLKRCGLAYITDPGGADVEAVNLLLRRYGRDLFTAGRFYGHYAETVNGVSAKRPVRRIVQGAWDVAYARLREEPLVHHLSMALVSVVGFTVSCHGMGMD